MSQHDQRWLCARKPDRAGSSRFDATGGSHPGGSRNSESFLRTNIREGATDAVNINMENLEQRFHGSMIAALRNPLIEVTARRLKNYVGVIRLDSRATLRG